MYFSVRAEWEMREDKSGHITGKCNPRCVMSTVFHVLSFLFYIYFGSSCRPKRGAFRVRSSGSGRGALPFTIKRLVVSESQLHK